MPYTANTNAKMIATTASIPNRTRAAAAAAEKSDHARRGGAVAAAGADPGAAPDLRRVAPARKDEHDRGLLVLLLAEPALSVWKRAEIL
jgi:hypothetical protein